MNYSLKNLRALVGSLALIAFLAGCSHKFAPLFDKAQKEFSDKNYIGAVDELNRALPAWKESDGKETKAQAYQLLGKSYHQIRNMDKAVEAYKTAMELSNNTYDSAYALGLYYLAANQPPQAREAFQSALRMKKDDPLALVGLGDSFFVMKNYAEAKAIYDRVIDTAPGVRVALENLALIQKTSGEKSESHAKKPAKTPLLKKTKAKPSKRHR